MSRRGAKMCYWLDISYTDRLLTGHRLQRWGIDYYSPCLISTPSVQLMFSLYLISTVHAKIVPYSIAHDESITHLHYQCPVCTPFLHVISTQYPKSKAHVQSVTYIYNQCPICTSPEQSMPSQCHIFKAQTVPNAFSPYLAFTYLYSLCSENTPSLAQIQTEPHLCSTSTTHFQSVHHLD